MIEDITKYRDDEIKRIHDKAEEVAKERQDLAIENRRKRSQAPDKDKTRLKELDKELDTLAYYNEGYEGTSPKKFLKSLDTKAYYNKRNTKKGNKMNTRLSSVLKKIKNSAKASYAIGTVGYSQEEPSSIAVFKDTNLSLNEALARTLGSDPYGDWQQGGKGVVALYDYDDNGEYIIGFSKQIHEVFVYDNFDDFRNDVINTTFLDIPEAQEILEPITDPKEFIATSNKLAKKYDTYTEEYGLLKLVATIDLKTMDVDFVI